MKKLFLILFMIARFTNASEAQSSDAWQFFAGYSYMRANVREYFKTSVTTPIGSGSTYSINNRYANLNGWDVSITENVKSWFGGTLDASGHYGSPQLLGTSTAQRAYSILYGPRFFRKGRKFTPFGHVLFGITHVNAEVSATGPHISDTSFTAAPGGGLDIAFLKKSYFRLFQAEYFHTNLQGDSHSHLRVSTGVVFDLNKK